MVNIVRILIIVYISADRIVSGALISRPRNTVVVVGESVDVSCETNITNKTVYWHYTDVNGKLQPPLFNNGQINPIYEVRNITVDTYDLRFQSVALHDAGTYTCQDANGIGEAQAAWLTILDKNPVCSNKTTAKGIELSCHVTFNGSCVPSNQLEPDAQWHCEPEVVNRSMEVNPLNETERTFRRLRSSVQLNRSHGVNCSFVLRFIPRTSDATIDSREPTYEFTWTHVEQSTENSEYVTNEFSRHSTDTVPDIRWMKVVGGIAAGLVPIGLLVAVAIYVVKKKQIYSNWRLVDECRRCTRRLHDCCSSYTHCYLCCYSEKTNPQTKDYPVPRTLNVSIKHLTPCEDCQS